MMSASVVTSLGASPSAAPSAPAGGVPEVQIPADTDFTDQGVVISPGATSAWDDRIHGMITPCAVVNINDDLVLYYIGADGDRGDGGPAHRKLGAATLADGADETAAWTKASGSNPLVAHNPNPGDPNENEEGVFSAGAYYDGSNVQCLFGGMEVVGGSSVDGDGVHVSLGADGLTAGLQTDKVIDASDGTVFGNGDEIFPIGLYRDASDEWWCMYTAKGGAGQWVLGWAHGNDVTVLGTTEEVTEVSGVAYTGSDPIDIGGGKVIHPLFRDSTGNIEIWQGTDAGLPSIGSLAATWSFAGLAAVTGQSMCGILLHLDRPRGLWLLFYIDSSFTGIGLKTASVVEV